MKILCPRCAGAVSGRGANRAELAMSIHLPTCPAPQPRPPHRKEKTSA